MTEIAVVGAGQAGCALVAKLRNEGFEGRITLIGEEPIPPYQRPPLSKGYVLGEMGVERLLLRPYSFYAENDITLRLSARVTAIDPTARTLRLEDGEVLAYDALALTTGSTPRRLPDAIGGNLPGVLMIRDVKNADLMATLLVEGGRVVVIGGGYIGLEAAAVCVRKGMEVVLVEAAPRILQRVAAPVTSNHFRALHRTHGVTIYEGVNVDDILGEEHVTGVRLANGTVLAADIVIVGVGIVPNASLAEAAGLKVENGIWTDEYAHTSDPHIWAAGDCASFPLGAQRIRLESVSNAIDHAEVAALNIMGKETPYAPMPWFWSDQYDCNLQIAGLNVGYDAVHVRRDGEAVSHWYYTGDRLIAVDAMGDARAFMVARRLIEAGKSPAPHITTDPATNLKSLLRA